MGRGRGLDWWLDQTRRTSGVQHLVRDLNRVYTETPALWALDTDPAGFEWIDADDAGHNVVLVPAQGRRRPADRRAS